MQDPYNLPTHEYEKPTPKPQRKQAGPKIFTQIDGTSKAVLLKGVKRQKKGSHAALYGKEGINKVASSAAAQRSVIDMMKITEGDSRTLYRALKRKYTTLEEESFKFAEELEKTDSEVKRLEEEKFSLLDELLMLEGLASSQFPVGGQPLRE
ncbi:hypothetical protein GOP47_0026092 [Adiantum capillus-veneris]|uniref:Uncharacterized protein n=1 Tax=Adiantum capillus-veneris TaxID=13818 RepID=A0A9D4U1P4_ADICA|nr:hypothetical protein GOP47_0026092 [Adiantum capillus-veneris]